MKSLETSNSTCRPPRLVNPNGRMVFCIHCFRQLGTEGAKTSRASLLARHTCLESDIAKLPAAPPPFN